MAMVRDPLFVVLFAHLFVVKNCAKKSRAIQHMLNSSILFYNELSNPID